MSFLTLSNADVFFQARDLQWRFYNFRNVVPTTRRVKLIGKKEFVVAAPDPKHETFIVYVTSLSVDSGGKVHPSKKAQIAHLKADETSSKVPSKYANFANVFSPRLLAELQEHTGISDHAIELMVDLQP